MQLSVIIPVYRAGKTLYELHRQLTEQLTSQDLTFEVILVEDCGGDDSWEIICQLSSEDPRTRGIKLNRNYGQHNALLCGIRHARYEVIVTMDDDLQHPPGEIPVLLAAIEAGADVVYGAPLEERHSLLRNLASVSTKWMLQKAVGAETARHASAFRAFRTQLREAFANYSSPTVSIDVLLTWGTNNFEVVRVLRDKRQNGTTGYTLIKLINHAFNLMTGFSTLPLRIASVLGFIFVFFGIGVLCWVLGHYLFSSEPRVPGFPFLASLVTIFSGVQLFTLGIFGEYLARIHFRTMNKPPYVVHKTSVAPVCREREGEGLVKRPLEPVTSTAQVVPPLDKCGH